MREWAVYRAIIRSENIRECSTSSRPFSIAKQDLPDSEFSGNQDVVLHELCRTRTFQLTMLVEAETRFASTITGSIIALDAMPFNQRIPEFDGSLKVSFLC
jgi:hypothetical protein